MSIERKVNLGGIALLLALLASAIVGASQFAEIRFGGEMHRKNQQASDLIADILPPPEYIIEPYLEATLLMRDPTLLSQRRARLGELEAMYHEREAYWYNSDLKPELKALLFDGTNPPAKAFWNELNERFIPAMGRRDMRTAAASYTALANHYAEHRQAIDRLVEAAIAEQGELQNRSEGEVLFTQALFIGLILVVVGMTIVAIVFMRRTIIRPLAQVISAIRALAAGAPPARVEHASRNDEIGEMARGFVELRDRLVAARTERDRQAELIADAMRKLLKGDTSVAIETGSDGGALGDVPKVFVELRERLVKSHEMRAAQKRMIIESIGAGLSRLAGGDVTARIAEPLDGAFAELAADFNEAVASLAGFLDEAAEATEQVGARTADIRQTSQSLAVRSEQQARTLAQTVSALAEVTVGVGSTARNAVEARAIAVDTRGEVERSGKVLARTVTAIGDIETAQNEIAKIVSVIDGIAFQTNLLALNAGVEAARAGDAGKGFAVVANEVRALALRCSEAATDIAERIGAASTIVTSGVGLVGETEESLQRITGRIEEICTTIDTIAQASREQADQLGLVDGAMQDMDQTTVQNTALVEETAVSINELASQAAGLRERLSRFATGRELDSGLELAA